MASSYMALAPARLKLCPWFRDRLLAAKSTAAIDPDGPEERQATCGTAGDPVLANVARGLEIPSAAGLVFGFAFPVKCLQ